MQTVEVLVASTIFMIALSLSASLARLPSAAEESKQLPENASLTSPEENEQELQKKIENDRLELQAQLESIPPPNPGTFPPCTPIDTIIAKANTVGVPAGISRTVTKIETGSPDHEAMQVSWNAPNQNQELRRRIYTRVGLGQCR